MKRQHIVTEEETNRRIDKLLVELNKDKSRTVIQHWLTNHFVTVNGQFIKANYKCQHNDVIEWDVPKQEETKIEPENIPLQIVFEDDDLLVVNKPKGMVVHPSAGHRKDTLVNALLYHCETLSNIGGDERPGIVHRIDKDTSGLLVIAKSNDVHENLSEQFMNKDVERKYEAIVHGVIDHDQGIIDAPIGRDPNQRQSMAVVENGKHAVTHFRVLERFRNFTYIECQLETGRTHQIRVHMKYIGHPLLDDPKYGPRKKITDTGQALHAKCIGFTHPNTGERLWFEVDAPDVFQKLLRKIRNLY